MNPALPVGKLPLNIQRSLLAAAPILDERVTLGPQIGADCAVLDLGERLLVLKSDPITFATAEIGWYLVQVNSNDIATTGARPRWMLLTMLLPEKQTTADLVEQISAQVFTACRELDISVIGGHTEITYGLSRPLLCGTLIGECERQNLVTPHGLRPGDTLILTKGVPIEGTAVLAKEFPQKLAAALTQEELIDAQNFIYDPGISILRDAQIATTAGVVTAMHDPTEGGLAAALWELAEAASCSLNVDISAVPIPPLAQKICAAFDLDPLATIASGALLLSANPDDVESILTALTAAGIHCAVIGRALAGPAEVWQEDPEGYQLLPRPEQDAIARVMTINV